jgi:ribosomal-protein-alanine N-acetyltransferase
MPNDLSVRVSTATDLEMIVDYFHSSTNDHLLKMGVDINKLPERNAWLQLLNEELQQPMESKKFFFVTWLLDDMPVGHTSINKILFGKEAYMHLHMWKPGERQKGHGTKFVALSLPLYFTNFNLEKLYCEPYALNPAPNSTMKKLRFEFIEQYETIPGYLNFQQPVNKWRLDLEKYKMLYQ